MRACVFGQWSLESAGREQPMPSGQVGALLELLLLRPAVVHAADDLVTMLWKGQTPDAVGRRRLRVTVSRLRTFLDDGDAEGLGVTHEPGGYRLKATPTALDRLQFEDAAARALASRRPDDADAALAQWAGAPYSGGRWPARARAERGALEGLRRALFDVKVAADGGVSRTAVRPPVLNHLILARHRLVRPLAKVGNGRLIAVTAPAGFGKSTLLAQWANEQPGPVAWLAPSAADDDPTRFWSLAQRALTVAEVLPSDQCEALTGSPESLAALRTHVEAAGEPVALVVDDAHHLASTEGTEALAALVPALLAAGVTVAVGSRLALPAEIWRNVDGAGVRTVDLADLRFTLDEVTALFPSVERARAERVWRTTEGWPVAIVSLIRSGAGHGGGEPAGAARTTVPGDLAAMAAYVSAEVIAALPADLAAFVLQIAPLDAFTVSLCDAVTGKRDAARKLTRLRRHGLFVVETTGESDLDTGWFRFHHGIGAELRRLARTAVDIERVHRRAARWHLQRGFKAAALRYATAARDREVIAAVAGDVMLEAVIRREFVSSSALIRTIHPDDVVANPRAHAVCFWIALIWLPQIERGPWLHSRARHFGDDDLLVLVSRASTAFREGRADEAVDFCERALVGAEQLSDGALVDLAPVLVGITLAHLVNARMLQGTLHHDDPLFARAVSAIRPFLPLSAAFVYGTWALVAALDGDEAKARTLAQEFNDIRCTTDAGTAPIERTLIGALLAAAATDDPARLRWIGIELERGMERLELLGNTSQLAMDRLVAASIHRRAGDPERAAHFQRLAETTIATFEDAPVFDRLRPLLDAQDVDRALMSLLLLGLSPRQRSVLPYLGTDLSVGQIAAKLHISVSTLRGHLQQIYVRLGVHSRVAAAARLSRLDLAPGVSAL